MHHLKIPSFCQRDELIVDLPARITVFVGRDGVGKRELFAAAHEADEHIQDTLFFPGLGEGVYRKALVPMWCELIRASRACRMWVMAYTHSWECLEAMARAMDETGESSVAIVRLERESSDTTTRQIVMDWSDIPIIVREHIEVR